MAKAQLTPLVSYWSMTEKELSFELEALKRAGTENVGALVPWDYLEKDTSFSLEKLLLISTRLNLLVRLLLSPELGTAYPMGAIPLKLLQKKKNLARDRRGRIVYNFAPPTFHPLVDFSQEEVKSSYESFLLLFSQRMKDFLDKQDNFQIDIIVGDSFFKHYHKQSIGEDMESMLVKSNLSILDRRRNHSKKEMTSSSPHILGTGVFERDTALMAKEEYEFRTTAFVFLKLQFSSYKGVRVLSRTYTNRSTSPDCILEQIGTPSLSSLFERISKEASFFDSICLFNLDKFNDRQKNFLISSSLVIYKDVCLESHHYLSVKPSFRKKMQYMEDFFSKEKLYKPVIALVENRFYLSNLVEKIYEYMGSSLQIYGSLQDIPSDIINAAELILVERRINDKDFSYLFEKSKNDQKNLIVFRNALSEKSINKLKSINSFHMNYKWKYEVFLFYERKSLLIINDEIKNNKDISLLIDKMLSMSHINKAYSCSERDLFFVSIKAHDNQYKRIVFFMNYLDKKMRAKISFSSPIKLEDVVEKLGGEEVAKRDHVYMELPPYSVVPIEFSYFQEESQKSNEQQLNESIK